jgi:Ca2+-transporting ATPase
MEKAIVEAYHTYTNHEIDEHLHMIHEYPLSGRPPMMTHVYILESVQVVAAKGAPERILRICKLDDVTIGRMEKIILEMTSSGYRILGVCSATNHSDIYPANQDDFNWNFEGFVSLYDPPKKNAGGVFKKWYQAGIHIKLITGDYAETAMNIASQTGIKDAEKYITGEQVMQLSPESLQQKVKEINVYARMFPDAKLKIVEMLKADHEIVGMTGDGVNDAPALKSAHIGIAMGNKGTELAKEAADLIITDDNLEKITDAIQQGRKIYSNLKKAIRYIVSIHIPIICTASIPLLLGWKFPNIFTPVHIIFLELIMGPTCSIFYEREPVEPNIMLKKPRHSGQNMFSGKELSISILQGLFITLSVLLLYYYFMHGGYPVKYVRTIVFTTLITCNIFLTFVNRSFDEALTKTLHYKNTLAPYILLISVIFLVLISSIKWVQGLFQLTDISALHYVCCVGTAFSCTGWFELYKGFINTNRISKDLSRVSI